MYNVFFLSNNYQQQKTYDKSYTSTIKYAEGLYYGGFNYDYPNKSLTIENLNEATTINYCFSYCSLKEVDIKLSNVISAISSFSSNSYLATFKSNLKSLSNMNYMFSNSKELKLIILGSLENVTTSNGAFRGCISLKSFNYDLPKCVNAGYMFEMDANKIDQNVFSQFRGSLPSLQYAGGMFSSCHLDSESLMYIYDGIKDWGSSYSRPITFGLGCSEDQKDDFAIEAGFDSFDDMNASFKSKGWNATWQFNGAVGASTYSMRRQPPIYAKVEETSEEEGRLTDGTKFYNVSWGHIVNGEGYDEYGSLQEVYEQYNLKEKE